LIHADEVHFRNITFNLLDSATQYAREKPRIQVETQTSGSMLIISTDDDAIARHKETQLLIFEKFYRAHTGIQQTVQGFGLGLTYVKTMVEAHNGRIRVESTPGKGSTFIISLPLV